MNASKDKATVPESKIVDNHSEHVHGPNCNHDHHHHDSLKPITRTSPKIGRNDPCACGSQKKFKKCCGA